MGYRILLTEGESAIAKTFIKRFEDYPFSLIVCGPDFDWSDSSQVKGLFEDKQPGLVVNTIAIANVQVRQFDRSIVELAGLCAMHDIPLIHLSSYEVFSDSEEEEFDESAEPKASAQVGQYLLDEENAVLASDCSIVIRLSWLIDVDGDNLLTKICEKLQAKQLLEVSDKRKGSPTHYDDVFRIVVAIIQQTLCGAENWGVFHLCTSDQCVEAEFADFISRILSAEGVDVGDYNVVGGSEGLIKANANLLGVRCNNNFGIQLRSWRQGVKAIVLDWMKRV